MSEILTPKPVDSGFGGPPPGMPSGGVEVIG